MAEGGLKATYASPGLRMGIWRDDHPTAPAPVFRASTAAEFGVPDEFGGKTLVCVAELHYIDGRAPDVGWISVPDKIKLKSGKEIPFARTPDNWNTLSTKALGRALKRAGYPDDVVDLKGLMHWRQRKQEIAVIGVEYLEIEAGPEQTTIEREGVKLTTGPAPDALEQAGRSTPDAVEHDDVAEVVAEEDDEPDGDDDPNITEAEIVYDDDDEGRPFEDEPKTEPTPSAQRTETKARGAAGGGSTPLPPPSAAPPSKNRPLLGQVAIENAEIAARLEGCDDDAYRRVSEFMAGRKMTLGKPLPASKAKLLGAFLDGIAPVMADGSEPANPQSLDALLTTVAALPDENQTWFMEKMDEAGCDILGDGVTAAQLDAALALLRDHGVEA